MKKILILLAIFTTFASTAQSVGINADGSTANASAILDLKSTTKGFLPPRMTLAQRSAISSPAAGLVLWCINCGNGELQVYNGIEWTNMLGGTALAGSPIISATTAATAIRGTSAISGGNVTDDNGNIITARGLCWSTSQNPTTANSITTESGTTGSFTSSITGLTPNATYYVRAYATNVAGTTYGSQVSFTTPYLPPIISATTAATAISATSATSGGNVTDDNGNIITARGLCWSTSQNPTTANSITTESGTTGSFTSSITGLTTNTTYYVRAYATNVAGTTYGTQVSFITSSGVNVGEQYQGGIVAYILATGDPGYNPNVQQGLIAASVDQGSNIPLSKGWNGSCFLNTGGQTSTILGTGSANTSVIIQSQTPFMFEYQLYELAAGLARSYRGGNYTDWYLPSKDELNKIYINKSIIGGFNNANYWSSSESSCQQGWYQDFSNGTQSTTYMDLSFYVRAVRSFTLTRPVGSITTLDASSPTNNGSLVHEVSANSVSSVVSYTGGNGGVHVGQTVTSTGVTGLTATLSAGSFATGSGTLTYTITGTPSSSGTASFALNIGGQTATLTRTVDPGSITTLVASSPTNTGSLVHGVSASSVSSVVSYTGGNGGAHNGQTVASTGVTGLTATLSAGSFASGDGTLTYLITGTPTSSGTASFALNIGGQTATLTRIVAGTIATLVASSPTNTGSLVYEVSASSVSSVVSYTGGTGGVHDGQTVTSTGVTGLTATLSAGSFAIGDGTLTYLITGTPSSSGTASFVLNIGGQTATLTRTVILGSITILDASSPTNTGSLLISISSVVSYTGGNGGRHTGQTVSSAGVTGLTSTLSAGSFADGNGTLTYTITGTPSSSGTASFALSIGGQTATLNYTVSDGTISSLNASPPTNTGSLVDGKLASGVSSVVSYTGGDGGRYDGQTVSSTGVTGLTATLSAGSFALGSGTLTYTITGTPSGSGTASFALNIGGQTATLTPTVAAGIIATLDASSPRTTGAQFTGYAVNGSSYVSYTGGFGRHDGQTVTSSGVTGLTATLSAGSFAAGSGTLTYTLTGTPSGIGTASFALNIGGITTTLNIEVVTLAIGQLYQGGQIIGINPGTTTGTIVSLSDQGYTNWNDANVLVSNHRGGGYTDWFLPNNGLLSRIYQNLNVLGGFRNAPYYVEYWSSESVGYSYPYNEQYFIIYFRDTGYSYRAGEFSYSNMAYNYGVRAVRLF